MHIPDLELVKYLFAEDVAKEMILDYVDKTGREPSEADICLPDECIPSVRELFQQLKQERLIIFNHYDDHHCVDIQQAQEEMARAGHKTYLVK